MKIIETWKAKNNLVNHLKLTGFKYDQKLHGNYPAYGSSFREVYSKGGLVVEFYHSKDGELIYVTHPKFTKELAEAPSLNSYKVALILVKRIFPEDKPDVLKYSLIPKSKKLLFVVGTIIFGYTILAIGIHIRDIFHGENTINQDLFTTGAVGLLGIFHSLVGIKSATIRAIIVISWLIALTSFVFFLITRQYYET